MRLTGIMLNNVRCFERYEQAFTAPLVMLIGDNGAGKSTLLDAIRWALTGTCRGLDRGGKGVDDGLRRRGTTAPVEVHLQFTHAGESYTVSRVWDRSTTLQINDWGGSIDLQTAELVKRLGVGSLDLLRVALDGDGLFLAAHADAKALVMALLDVRVPFEGLQLTLAELDVLYDNAVGQRRLLKEGVPKTAPVPPGLPRLDVEDIQRRLDAIKKEHAEKLLARAEAVGRVQGLSQAAWERAVDALNAQIAEAQARLKQPEVPEVLGERDYMMTVAACEARLLELRAQVPDASASSADALEQFDPANGCVLDAKIRCPQKASRFTAVAKLRRSQSVGGDVSAAIAEQEQQLAQAQANLDAARRYLRDCEEREAARQAIERLESELRAMAAPVAVADTSAVDAEIATLQSRIEKGSTILADAQTRHMLWNRYEERVAELNALALKVATAEQRCQVLGPKGIRVAAIEAAMGRLYQALNPLLKPFGFELSLSVEPWALLINGKSFVCLSVSERMRVATALQLAVAQMVGLGFTLIDSVDWLLTAHRQTLTHVVRGANLDQVVLAKAQEQSVPITQSPALQVVSLWGAPSEARS